MNNSAGSSGISFSGQGFHSVLDTESRGFLDTGARPGLRSGFCRYDKFESSRGECSPKGSGYTLETSALKY
jgi:hypothetical protein